MPTQIASCESLDPAILTRVMAQHASCALYSARAEGNASELLDQLNAASVDAVSRCTELRQCSGDEIMMRS